jgi:hypothetical protein
LAPKAILNPIAHKLSEVFGNMWTAEKVKNRFLINHNWLFTQKNSVTFFCTNTWMRKINIIYIICQVFKLIKYPVSGRIFFRYPANPVSGRIVKITIRCTPSIFVYLYQVYRIPGPPLANPKLSQWEETRTPMQGKSTTFWQSVERLLSYETPVRIKLRTPDLRDERPSFWLPNFFSFLVILGSQYFYTFKYLTC